MITRFNIKKDLYALQEFLLNKYIDKSTFYYTENNQRVFVTLLGEIKNLLRQSNDVFISKNDRDYIDGVILIWRGDAGDVKRRYVKVCGQNKRVIDNLLTILLWSINNTELFVKLEKKSFLSYIFAKKGFRFFHDRGKEILLCRQAVLMPPPSFRDKDGT